MSDSSNKRRPTRRTDRWSDEHSLRHADHAYWQVSRAQPRHVNEEFEQALDLASREKVKNFAWRTAARAIFTNIRFAIFDRYY